MVLYIETQEYTKIHSKCLHSHIAQPKSPQSSEGRREEGIIQKNSRDFSRIYDCIYFFNSDDRKSNSRTNANLISLIQVLADKYKQVVKHKPSPRAGE